jgi:hypothetical protein
MFPIFSFSDPRRYFQGHDVGNTALDRLLSCPLFQTWTNSLSILYHHSFVTVIYMYFEAVLLQVSLFMLFLTFSRSCACTLTLYSYLYSSVPLTYFCGHLLDINKIILSYLSHHDKILNNLVKCSNECLFENN